ncbi:MAG TPA: metabolite traffic protein EboE [Verrucomicrobiae bacterium]|nr:metabolite traffic protein EboE [Verrucomicrobiae bacterium]
MKLNHGIHLAYCTNVHRGETWAETFESLETFTLAIKRNLAPTNPFAIGLRLSARAARELSEPEALLRFQRWLDQHGCYVFTINGFPYGKFHGTRVKEQVYLPDWTSAERLAYTNLLFDLLARLLPEGVEGSVSTAPCGFKPLISSQEQHKRMRKNLHEAAAHIAKLTRQTGRELHLGLEPEPGCVLETTAETVEFFETLRAGFPADERIARHLGVNYDACHLAVEFEDAATGLNALRSHGIRLSKLHLSSALKVIMNSGRRSQLAAFADPVYFHQTMIRRDDGSTGFYFDLDEALREEALEPGREAEWRVHFHVPLHSPPGGGLGNTSDHLLATLDWLAASPGACRHLEIETYTWEVLPPAMKSRALAEQMIAEYQWTLRALAQRELAPKLNL